MEFEPYIHLNDAYNGIVAIVALFIAGAVGAGLTYLVCLLFRVKDKISPSLFVGGCFAAAGLFSGFVISYSVDNNSNMDVLKQNITQKYGSEVEIVDMGVKPNSKGAPYRAIDWEAHEVKIKTSGKTSVAVLSQNKDTNEPTLTDFDTHQPLPQQHKDK